MTWDRIKKFCLHSLTIAWGYCLIAFGALMEVLNSASLVLNDPTITQEVTKMLGASPRALAVFSGVAGLGAIAARMRTLIQNGKGGQ